MIFFDFNFRQLLIYGIHVGHSISNSLLYCAWFISAFRQSTAIINLFKSILMFRVTFLLLSNILAFNGPVWFINMDKSTERYIRYSALSCGEFFVTTNWVRGSISNYPNVFNSYRNLAKYSKFFLSKKKAILKFTLKHWLLTRHSWPRLVFSSNLNLSYVPIHEATSLKIPCASIVDTNSWSQNVSLAIPGNDESLNCIAFYNDLFCNFILNKKFSLICSWYVNIRVPNRLVNFLDWISYNYSSFNNKNILTIKPKENISLNFYKKISLFYSMNYWKFSIKENLDLIHFININNRTSELFIIFSSFKYRLFSYLNLYFYKKYFISKSFYKNIFVNDLMFKHKYINDFFIEVKFYNASYLKNHLYKPFKFYHFIFRNVFFYYFIIKYYKIKLMRYIDKGFLHFWSFFVNILFLKNFVISDSIKNKNKKKPFNKIQKGLFFSWKKEFNFNILDMSKLKLNFNISNIKIKSIIPNRFWLGTTKFIIFNYKFYNPFIINYSLKKRRNGYIRYLDSLLSKKNKSVNLKYLRWYWK